MIDSIVRQSRHQFGVDKDVFGPRFTRNFTQTFHNLFLTCPTGDKPKIVRVLNLWQRNNVFSSEIIQPLLDMANPSANLSQIKFDKNSGDNLTGDLPSGVGSQDNDSEDLMLSLQQLAASLGIVKNANNGANLGENSSSAQDSATAQQNAVRFNKKLLEFNYSDDEDDLDKSETPTEAEPPTSAALSQDDANANPLALSMAQNLLSNPELLQRLQQMQQTIQQNREAYGYDQNSANSSGPNFSSAFASLNEQNKSVSNANSTLFENDARSRDSFPPDKSVYEFNYPQNNSQKGFARNENAILASNNPTYQSHTEERSRSSRGYGDDRRDYDYNYPERREYYDQMRGKSPSPRRSRFSRNSPRSFRDKDERVRDRSRSPGWRSERRNYEARGRNESPPLSPESARREKEREKERERRKRGLPQVRKGHLTICSTTLWLGHVPKLVSEADISNTFGEFGTINSIDVS